MQIFQIYVTAIALAVVGLIISMLTTAVTRSGKSTPPSSQTPEEEQLKLAWWVKVITAQPHCTYYFGPFSSKKSAEASQTGYVEDLEAEGARGITTQVKWYKPTELTIYEDMVEASSYSG